MKIVVCGGMGYIGSALIECYRDEAEHEVIAVDKRFVPHLVAGLPRHIRFVEGNILDRDLMKPLLDGASVVYQMAAEVEAEKSKHKPEAVWENNVDGAKNVIDLCGPKTRLIFPSTGNVFGGVDESVKYMNLTEEDEPHPRLPYAESKVHIEQYLASKADSNYTIVRYGTNYGFAPGIRFNLVTNIFTKRMIQGQNIMLHGGGKNFRPTVHVMDCARAARFLAALPGASRQTYHVVRECYRICDLAEKIAQFNDRTELIATDDVVPFSSYHLSNEKLLAAGYEFSFDLESGVREMVEVFKPMAMT